MNQRQMLIDFHPQYLHRHCGMDFGRDYHMDPLLRRRETLRQQEALHRRFPRYGTLFPAPPKPDAEVREIEWIGVQPLDFLNAALGGRLEFSAEEAVWTPDKPLARIESLDDIAGLPEIDWDTQWLYQNFLRQLETLEALDPGCPSAGIQGACSLGNGQAKLSTHSSYTTAFRLMGERIFEWMLLDEEAADALFRYIYRQYRRQAEHFCRRQGWQLTRIHFGDCAATMLSPDLFRQSNARIARDILAADAYQGCTLHSCGPSTHLLEAFQEVPLLEELQLGYGTDLGRARNIFPQTKITAYYSAAALLTESPAQIQQNLERMTAELQDNFVVFASSIDARTPEESLNAFLDYAEALNRAQL